MKRPDSTRMLQARAEIDEHLNKVLVLLAESPEASIQTIAPDYPADLVKAHIYAARRALERFEEACHAEARA